MGTLKDATGRTSRTLDVRAYTSDNEATEGQRLALITIRDIDGETLGNINVSAAELRAALSETHQSIFQSVIQALPELTAGQTSTVVDLIEGASK